jgi:uncharacterized membrane protein
MNNNTQRRSLRILLLLSLLLNVAVLAGFLYQRYFALPDTRIEVIAERLGLSETEQQALADMRHAVFAEVRNLRRNTAEPNAALRRLVTSRSADDSELAAALGRIADERALIQKDAITRLIAFRDSLSPQARQRFGNAILQKGFMLSLFGVSSWGLPQAAENEGGK